MRRMWRHDQVFAYPDTQVTASGAMRLWGQVASHAAARGGIVSVADVCARSLPERLSSAGRGWPR